MRAFLWAGAAAALTTCLMSWSGAEVVSSTPRDLPWFSKLTGIQFPPGTTVEHLDAEESFIGSGGHFWLTIRPPEGTLPSFTVQPALQRPAPGGGLSRIPRGDGFREVDVPRSNGTSRRLLMSVHPEPGSGAVVSFDFLY